MMVIKIDDDYDGDGVGDGDDGDDGDDDDDWCKKKKTTRDGKVVRCVDKTR